MHRSSCKRWKRIGHGVVCAVLMLPVLRGAAETCTTQSAMSAAQRDALAGAAQSFARLVQAGDTAAIRAATIPQYAGNFEGIGGTVAAVAPRLAGMTLNGSPGLYLLDASGNKETSDAQFFCSPANATASTIFSLPSLPPGLYALATVRAEGAGRAWQLSFVLQQVSGKWLLAGFIPRAATAAGHDGVWYWTQARQFVKQGQRWSAWLYYTEADALLSPVEFVTSPNREKLRGETEAAAPAAASGISAEKPLMVKGAETFAVTALGVQESQDGKTLELAVHVMATDVSQPAAVRARSMQALTAVLGQYPELRGAFGGAWVYADAPGQSSFGIEFAPLPVQAQGP